VGPQSRTILFGSAPGREAAGEPLAAAKIARLRTLEADAHVPEPEQSLDLTRNPEEDVDAVGGPSIPSIPSQ
jgi:hypothetical protein